MAGRHQCQLTDGDAGDPVCRRAVFFLGFELFGLPLVLGDPQGVLVLSTYLYKLTNKLGCRPISSWRSWSSHRSR